MTIGRPTALTPEMQTKIVTAIKAGNYRETACRAAGISDRSMRTWIVRGNEGEEPYASFAAALDEAEAQAEVDMLAKINGAKAAVTGISGPDLWQATAWTMERRWPKRWAARVRTAVVEECDTLMRKLSKKPELAEEVSRVLAAEGGEETADAKH